MIKTLIDFSEKYGLLPRGELILCAVSGGADSVALLHALFSLKERFGVKVAAAHYNHGIRRLAGRDEQFVKNLCEALKIPFYCGHGDVPAEAKRLGMGTEEAARRLRYEFLEKTADETGAGCIATAHTADDMLETVIMNLARGSGSLGAAGIPPVRGRIVRPMLTVTRAEIEKYLAENGLDHVEDETNTDFSYTRNRVRGSVAPVLRGINPRAAENFAAAALRIREDAELLDELAEKLEKSAVKTGRGLTISAKTLRDAPRPLASRCIRALGGGLTARQTDAVLALAGGDDPSAETRISENLVVRRVYDALVFSGETEEKTFAPRPVALEGETYVPELKMKLVCRRAKKIEKIHNSVNTFYVDCDMIKDNFMIRPRCTGDSIKLKGRPEKSLKKLFIEQKLPRGEREAVPVLADENGVVAVLGFGQDERRSRGAENVYIIETQTEE